VLRTLFLEVLGFKPHLFLLLKKIKKILGNILPFFEKEIEDNFYFIFGFASANMTNFSNFMVKFRKKLHIQKMKKKKHGST
jgi:hypothetical protein